MYSSFQIATKFLRHWAGASNGKGHGIHSPFVFDFVIRVLNDRTKYEHYSSIERLRKKLLSDNTPVPFEDFGAGSSTGKNVFSKSVSMIAASAAKSPKYAQLLHRLVRYYRPHYVLELGTSLGISTAYLASGDSQAVVVTGEGNHVLATRAGENFRQLRLDNIKVVAGDFDNTLPEMMSALPHVDFAFIDGNHREQPTIAYFNQLLTKIPESSILVFDDIHWSTGMQSAWQHIQDHPAVMLTVDLFHMGIIFFRPEFKVKQHFRIRF